MKIGLNAIGFAPGKMGGVETYLRALVGQLQQLDHDHSYTILCDESNKEEFRLHNPAFTAKVCTYRSKTVRRKIQNILWNTLGIDLLRAKPKYQQLDLIHHPFTTIDKQWWRIPSVLTFWDMQHEFYPNFFSPRELEKRFHTYRPSVANATKIIVSSGFTRDCLVERYGVNINKISVIYTGVSPDCLILPSEDKLSKIRTAYNLDRPFIYYPAATWPHKNHKILLDAFKLLCEYTSFTGDLVLTGIAMQSNDTLMAEIGRLGLAKRVKVLGYLPKEELPCLYHLARIMVFPSLFEGFGIPLVEAMACGCPVICANTTSLPEVIGTAGELFDPASYEELSTLVWKVWNDDDKLSNMRQAGLLRSQLFDWQHTVKQTMDVYKQVLI